MLVAEGGIKLSALYPKQKSEGTTSDRPTSNRLAHNPCAHNSPPRKWQMVTRGTIRPSCFGLTCRLTMNGEYIYRWGGGNTIERRFRSEMESESMFRDVVSTHDGI